MRGLICPAPGALELTDTLPEPGAPPPGWALLQVEQVGICGTDYHIYEGKHPFLTYPRVMGHEIAATVLVPGDGVTLAAGTAVIVNPYLSCGTCLACRNGKPNCCARIEVLGVHRDGAMCERILVPAGNLYPAGDLGLTGAAAVEFLAIGAHAVRRSLAPAGARALVIGAGPIGLGAAIFARIAGHRVTLLDTEPERLAFARDRLGLAQGIVGGPDLAEQVAARTGGEGFDVVFDATGNAASMRGAIAHVAQGGALVYVGVVRDEIAFPHPEFHRREMMLIASRNAVRADFDHVAESLRAGRVPLDALVTHRLTLDEAVTALPRLARTKAGLIKAVIRIGRA